MKILFIAEESVKDKVMKTDAFISYNLNSGHNVSFITENTPNGVKMMLRDDCDAIIKVMKKDAPAIITPALLYLKRGLSEKTRIKKVYL